MKEKLISSALMFQLKNSEYQQILTGKRHCDIFEEIYYHKINYIKESLREGFMTDTFRFVDRYETVEIAKKQINFQIVIKDMNFIQKKYGLNENKFQLNLNFGVDFNMTHNNFENLKENCEKNNLYISGDENNFHFQLLTELGCLFKNLIETKEN